MLMQTVRQLGRAAAVTALLAGSLALAPSTQAQTVDQIKSKGTITVGVMVDFPPFGLLDKDNKPDGYDEDIARLLAKDLGVKLDFVPVSGPNRVPYLLTGKVDLIIGALGITPERAKQVQFSDIYATTKLAVYGQKGVKVESEQDLKNVRIGVARASTQDMAITKRAPEGTRIQRYDDDASAVQALLAGQVQVIGLTTTLIPELDKIAPKGAYEIKLPLDTFSYGIAMRPGQDDLLKGVDAFLAKIKQDGTLNQLHRKWLGTDFVEPGKS
ncbi:MAG TPA: transporter substrate-binding domain-containing protein [Bordetella sp.]